jgi:hypothetical protein
MDISKFEKIKDVIRIATDRITYLVCCAAFMMSAALVFCQIVIAVQL